MLREKAGETAGKIWNALNETAGLTAKQIKKATKLVDKMCIRDRYQGGYIVAFESFRKPGYLPQFS